MLCAYICLFNRMVGVSFQASTAYKESILEGTASPISYGLKERIIRLVGSASDTTVLSMYRYGPHILPVYENAENVQFLTKQYVLQTICIVPHYATFFWHTSLRSSFPLSICC